MTHDIPFEFHQNANFLYLTGIEEPGAHAVLVKRNFECSFALFVLPRDPHRCAGQDLTAARFFWRLTALSLFCSEQWDGARIGLEAARERYGADEAFQVTDLERGLSQILKGLERVFVLSPDGGKFPASFISASKGFHDKFISGDILVEQLRVVKSERELERMRVAAKIGCQGFIDMMKNTHPGMTERALAAEFEGSCKRNGALGNSFPNVVGSGPNAAVIHYLAKRDILRPNELVLVDSGCVVAGGYASDITRTWPTGGELPTGHKALYEFVLDVQKKCIAYLRQQIESKQPVSLDNVHDYSVTLMMDAMKEFGIMKKSANAARFSRGALVEFQRYNPTHIGHYLGMDVHDTPHVTRGAPLVPGMIITIEPGIYLPKNDLDLPEEFRGVGIRIEDDVVVRASLRCNDSQSSIDLQRVCSQIAENGIEILTSKVPKELKEMEDLRNS